MAEGKFELATSNSVLHSLGKKLIAVQTFNSISFGRRSTCTYTCTALQYCTQYFEQASFSTCELTISLPDCVCNLNDKEQDWCRCMNPPKETGEFN